jgi:hypothetical protein
MEYILNNTLLALLEYPDATLLGVNRMFTDKDYRKKVVDHITDPSIKSFWVDEYAKYTDRYTQEATPAIQNKVGQFVSNPLIRNIIGQPKSTFDIRKMMDEKKILIMNLSKGKVGEQNTNFLGSMLITKIYLAAMSRADASREEMRDLPNFYFFVDEFQSFANESFADILSEARKYHLNLTIAHQYIEQMQEEVRAAVFGNVGTMITFRVGSFDADVLEKEFLPAFSAEDIVNLDKYQLYLRLMIDGVGSKPFSAVALPPIPRGAHSFKEEILKHSREFFGRKRAAVEEEIVRWYQTSYAEPKPERPRMDNGAATVSNGTGFTPSPARSVADSRAADSPSLRPQIHRSPGRAFIPALPLRAENRYSRNGNSGGGSNFRERAFPPRNENRSVSREQRSGDERMPPRSQPIPPAPSLQTDEKASEKLHPALPSTEVVPETPRPVPVSLDTLRRGSSARGTEPTQNRNILKEALSGILNDVKKAEKKGEETIAGVIETRAEPPKETPQSHAPKEIPEDVLRGMLSVDEKE